MTASPDSVRTLVSGVLKIDKVRVADDSALPDLGATSIHIMEIINEVDGVFGVELTDEQMDEVGTVEDLRKLINAELEARETA